MLSVPYIVSNFRSPTFVKIGHITWDTQYIRSIFNLEKTSKLQRTDDDVNKKCLQGHFAIM